MAPCPPAGCLQLAAPEPCTACWFPACVAQVGWYTPRGPADGILHLDCPLQMRVRGPGPLREPAETFLNKEASFLEKFKKQVRNYQTHSAAHTLRRSDRHVHHLSL